MQTVAYMHTCMHAHACMHAYLYTYVYTYIDIHIDIYICVQVFVCLYAKHAEETLEGRGGPRAREACDVKRIKVNFWNMIAWHIA